MTRSTTGSGGSSSELARRLKELRETGFSGRPVTQRQLADALGRTKPLSISSISAYENPAQPPAPAYRLRDYATFFATERSLQDGRGRLVPEEDLSDEELAARDALLDELRTLAEDVASDEPPPRAAPGRAIWSFPDGEPVRIICGQLADMTHPYADPRNRNYTELLRYADLDALMELYAHVWRLNPSCDIRFMLDSQLRWSEDLQSHLVILGGSGLNPSIQRIVTLTELPIRQLPDLEVVEDGDIFELDGSSERFLPVFDAKLGLVEDVGLLARLANPYNSARTLTVCSGVFSPGVRGAVRTLTDAALHDGNESYLSARFADAIEFSALMRVPVVNGQVVTPDLGNPSTHSANGLP